MPHVASVLLVGLLHLALHALVPYISRFLCAVVLQLFYISHALVSQVPYGLSVPMPHVPLLALVSIVP